MSCTSPLTVASTMRPLLVSPSAFSMYGSRCATAVFIVSADCSTNGSCISPEPKSSPTTFMPSSSTSLMIESAGVPPASASSRSSIETVAVAVDDAVLQPLVDRPARAVLLDRRPCVCTSAKTSSSFVAAGRSPARRRSYTRSRQTCALLVGDAVQRHDAAGVHDGGVEPGLDALVQEHRVERVACRGAAGRTTRSTRRAS